MTSQPNLVQPPSLAVWLVSLFVPPQDAESILGDLCEEFSFVASRSGDHFARRWYWRQSLNTALRLAGLGFRTAPWLTMGAVVGGFLLRRLLGPLVAPTIFAVLEHFQVFDRHFGAYRFFASTGIDLGHLMVFLLIGFVVALAARGREMVAAMTLCFFYTALALVGSLAVAIRTGDGAILWRLTWYFADSFAIVIAGALVRMWRFAATNRATPA